MPRCYNFPSLLLSCVLGEETGTNLLHCTVSVLPLFSPGLQPLLEAMATDIYQSLDEHVQYHLDNDVPNSNLITAIAEQSQNEDIKSTILLYSTTKDLSTIRKELNRVDINILKNTADYLGLQNCQDYKTPSVITTKVVTKLNALMRCICAICSKYYNTGDDAALYCSKCSRPCHDDCYKTSLQDLKPGISLVFNCYQCTKKTDADLPAATVEPTAETSEETVQPNKPNIEIATTNSDNQQKTPILKVINAYNLDQLQARYQQPNYTNCVPYLKGECPHGRRGLDEVEGEICSNLHPKKCFPWVRAGNNEQHGCTKGRDCEFYHPRLCNNSVRYRRCTNPHCTFVHLRFTKRYNNRRQEENYQHRQPHMSNPSSAPNQNQHTPQPREYIPPPWINRMSSPAVNNSETENSTNQTNQPHNMSFLVSLIESMKEDMRNANAEMLAIKKTMHEQVLTYQPHINRQIASVSQELQEFRDLKGKIATNHMMQVSAPVNQAPLQMQPMQTTMNNQPFLQHHLVQAV